MLSVLFDAAAFVLALGVLIAFHEFGHFWVARKLGVKVLRFAVGFGKPLWKKTAGDDQIEYVLGAVPLGGYVKMLDEREGPVAAEERHRAFNNQSVWVRSAIVVAGPLFNGILAVIAFWLVFVSGIPEIKPLLGDVPAGSPAALAGFRAEDELLAINGRETPSWGGFHMVLIDEGIRSHDTLAVDVLDADQQRLTRYLNLNGMPLLADDGDVMEKLGFHLWAPAAVIAGVEDNGPAAQAGLQAGDRVLRVDGVAVTSWSDWAERVRAKLQQPMTVDVLRKDQTLSLNLTPAAHPKAPAYGYVGASAEVGRQLLVTLQYGPWDALTRAANETWKMSLMYLRVIGQLITGEASLRNVSGPITIAHYAGETASIGLEHFLRYLALISVSLAVLNLLPVPMLDGGHLLYFLIEAVIRRPVPEKVQVFGQQIGLAILLCLMGLAFYNDLSRLIIN